MLWMLAAAMAAVVALAIMAPFLRGRGTATAEPAAAYDLRVYRAQLAEVERDLARGVIAAEDAGRLRAEIGRKVLDADRALSRAEGAVATAGRGRAYGVGVAVVAAASLAFALYLAIGRPGMPDQPMAARIAAAKAVYDARPSQAEAEAQAPSRPPTGVPAPEYLALVEELRAAVARRPDDPEGLTLLARSEANLGRAAEAAAAMRRVVELRGSEATGADHASLAGLMVEAAGGIVTPEAEAEIARALERDRWEPQARYLRGLLLIQNQRPDLAFPVWRDLLAADPSAPWAAPIRAVIGDLAWFAGQPDYVPPGAAAPMLPGPDAGAVEAAGEMTAEQREEMIGGMVVSLQERLATVGGTPEEWGRLITSLAVLGQWDRAGAILEEARQTFRTNPEAAAVIEAAAIQAGMR
ncbi:c-type cytochrome biogenesis protein CcmI [Paracoccus sp. S-4012]|nr:c-type cytochrome biogenesis protein CcmI [Paracoccus sp. S-4012]